MGGSNLLNCGSYHLCLVEGNRVNYMKVLNEVIRTVDLGGSPNGGDLFHHNLQLFQLVLLCFVNVRSSLVVFHCSVIPVIVYQYCVSHLHSQVHQ